MHLISLYQVMTKVNIRTVIVNASWFRIDLVTKYRLKSPVRAINICTTVWIIKLVPWYKTNFCFIIFAYIFVIPHGIYFFWIIHKPWGMGITVFVSFWCNWFMVEEFSQPPVVFTGNIVIKADHPVIINIIYFHSIKCLAVNKNCSYVRSSKYLLLEGCNSIILAFNKFWCWIC